MIANKQNKQSKPAIKMGAAPYKQHQQQQKQQPRKVTVRVCGPNTSDEYVGSVLYDIFVDDQLINQCSPDITVPWWRYGPRRFGKFIGELGSRLALWGKACGRDFYAWMMALYAVYPAGYVPDAAELKYICAIVKAMMKYNTPDDAWNAYALPDYKEPDFKRVERLISDAVSAIGTSPSAGTSVSGDSSLPSSVATSPATLGGAVDFFHQEDVCIAHMMTEMMDRVVARAAAREAAEVAEVVANVAAEIVQQVVARAVAEEVAEAKATALAEAKAAKAAAIQAAVVKARAAKAAADRAAELSRRVRTEFPVIQHDTRPIRGHGRAQVLNGWWFEYGTWMVRTVEMHVTSSSYSGNQAFLVGHVVYVHPVMPFWFQ